VPSALPAAGRQQLQRDLNAILAADPLARGHWGVVVRSLKSGETLYAINSHKLMMPASALKVVTLAAAAERLGWDFSYETAIRAVGTVESGVLNGDLLVVGSGDPSVTEDTAPALFAHWAERLKASGISTVAGRIIGDDNAFEDEPLGMGWSWDDLPEAYAAGIGALQFNENMARVIVAPGASVGMPASVTIEPDVAGLAIHSSLTTSDAQTPGMVRLRRGAGSRDLEVRGSLPIGNPVATRLVSVDNPTMYFVAALKKALVASGIQVWGRAVDIDEIGNAPAKDAGVLVVSHRSPPLAALALRLMKNSQNQYGETLFRTVGSTAAVDVLKAWGMADGQLVQRDGSGLSRYNYVTPDALVAILEHVYRDEKLRSPFDASLPLAGVDGSLANRLKGTPAEGNARAKTGSMSNVRALAGYVTSVDGEPLAFSILANNFEAPATVVNGATDAVVVRLAQFRR
jgi:D-alanyl-D-alanine carboxypeptidase/D-alanyl-D-alanine-endopeptidase (penicillin-binding protein 4)